MRKSYCSRGICGVKFTDNCPSYDMYRDIEEKLAEGKNVKYADRYICGLPVGLQLPNGVVIGASA
jgi:hypothetical protein